MTIQNITVGTQLPPLQVEPISRKTLALFAGASGDHQPSHLDIDAARAKGRDDVIAHGMLMMAYLGRLLTNWAPQEKLRFFRARFIAITPVKAEPTCTGRIASIESGLATIELEIRLADGTPVVLGEAVVDIAS
jgi:acyl dehydratase